MSFLHIKAYGFNDTDYALLKSMLNLTDKSLLQKWQLIEKGHIDLAIYSLDSDEGSTAWQQHKNGTVAVLASEENMPNNERFILKKPLRSKNLTQILNAVSQQINANNTDITVTTTDKSTKKPSFLSNLSQRFRHKKTPRKELPSLNFSTPEKSINSPHTITDPELLSQWLKQLPENDNDKIISAILGNLTPLNRTSIPGNNRLTLLDIYRRPIHKLVFNRDLTSIQRETSSPAEFLKAINNLSNLLGELIIAYKIIINEYYQSGEHPNSNSRFLIAINRLAELISLLILHSYRYYRSPPSGSIQDLHQLYIYCEASNTLSTLVSIKDISIDNSFFHNYSQLMLTNIAEPFSLEKYDIFRLFNLMGTIADQIKISHLSDKQIKASSQLLLASNFYISGTSDHPPRPLSSINIEDRKLPQARLLNTYPVLHVIDDMAKSFQKGTYNLDFQLLQKIRPQIDASYQREYERMPSVEVHQVNIASGVVSIHHCLDSNDFSKSLKWTITNKSEGGIMATRNSDRHISLNIGDFIAIFDSASTPLLGVIRWLHINKDTTRIGLELHSTSPTAITFIPDGETEIFQGLLLAEVEDSKQGKTVIVNKGVFSNNRIFRVKEGDETYSIITDTLIHHTLHFEQFSFKLQASS
ncbi:MAG: hypothetical protein HRT92_01860 [Piscirickettsiaceae bacterium]|nr:hypothetical protein [Piscirickettsiaceae bacterium]